MAICYESTQIGDVRAEGVTAVPGIGVSRLQFTLQWLLHPKRDETYSVFGTYVRVSVAPEGTAGPLFLGQALAEVAWAEESRPGVPFERPVMQLLNVSAAAGRRWPVQPKTDVEYPPGPG